MTLSVLVSEKAMVDKYLYTKRRALYFASKGLNCCAISRALASEDLSYTPKSVFVLIKKCNQGEGISRKPRSGRPTKITQQVKDLIEEQMQIDDETTAAELKHKLEANEIYLSHSTILRCRRELGWTYRGSAYCQLIREQNKVKRLSWCLENQNNDFCNVVWTDETSVQLENHRRFCHRKRGQKPHPKPR